MSSLREVVLFARMNLLVPWYHKNAFSLTPPVPARLLCASSHFAFVLPNCASAVLPDFGLVLPQCWSREVKAYGSTALLNPRPRCDAYSRTHGITHAKVVIKNEMNEMTIWPAIDSILRCQIMAPFFRNLARHFI